MRTQSDTPTPPPSSAPLDKRWAPLRWLAGLPLAAQFLTVLPVPAPVGDAATDDETPGGAPPMTTALPWFPLVGAALGALLALVDWALTPVFAHSVRDALLLAIPALLTGMLHLDGFADCCDALLGTRPAARRLEILRDSRVGAYGVVGVVLLLVLRYAALGALPPAGRAAALVAAPLLGRWAMVYAVVGYPYARATGAGSGFRGDRRHLAAATLLALIALTAALWLSNVSIGVVAWHAVALRAALGAILACLAAVVSAAWCRWASRRLGGGLTGDTYGALNELVELAVLLAVPPLLTALPHL